MVAFQPVRCFSKTRVITYNGGVGGFIPPHFIVCALVTGLSVILAKPETARRLLRRRAVHRFFGSFTREPANHRTTRGSPAPTFAKTEKKRPNAKDGHDLGGERFTDSTPLFLRKEVIQPQVLLRLPCYDFTPVINTSLDACLLRKGWPNVFCQYQLPWCDGRCVQGPGTYSPRHAVARLLAIPASCSRVADCNPN